MLCPNVYVHLGQEKIVAKESMSNTSSITFFPACFVEIPSTEKPQRAAFYLATEEYLATNYPLDNYFFIWQTLPTVVIGRHQVLEQEVNLEFCKQRNIDIIRRKSGGGCIYSDGENIMLSFVTGAGPVEPIFKEYAQQISQALKTLGANVLVSGRNDITLEDGRKICGNSFYHLPQRNIVHGTMLYNFQPETMRNAITPSNTKLKSHGVESVRSRVGSLKEFLKYDIEGLKQQLKNCLCNRHIVLTQEDIQAIKKIEEGYYSPHYLHKKNFNHSTFTNKLHFEGCGTIELTLSLKESTITEIHLNGDFFELSDSHKLFQDTFVNVEFSAPAIKQVIKTHHPEQAIRNLTEKQLIHLFDLQP